MNKNDKFLTPRRIYSLICILIDIIVFVWLIFDIMYSTITRTDFYHKQLIQAYVICIMALLSIPFSIIDTIYSVKKSKNKNKK